MQKYEKKTTYHRIISPAAHGDTLSCTMSPTQALSARQRWTETIKKEGVSKVWDTLSYHRFTLIISRLMVTILWSIRESNPLPFDCEPNALPNELIPQLLWFDIKSLNNTYPSSMFSFLIGLQKYANYSNCIHLFPNLVQYLFGRPL